MIVTKQDKILFVSTFPPRKCGIASFTQDLANAVNLEVTREIGINICALDKLQHAGLYDRPVSMVMDGYNLESCFNTAEKINQDDAIKLICIEHEFGLYGGDFGEYLLGFLTLLEKPFIIRFHTVLPTPAIKMLKVVQSIGLLAERMIVMTKHSARLLIEDYEIGADKITVIPHGTHDHCTTDVAELKLKYNLENKQVLTTFGLLSPNKGIENGILAMKEISAKIPGAVYIVVGQTHPNLLATEGEQYRNFLQQLIADNDLQANVRLINEYVPVNKLMEYLALTDIYLFTSKDPNQAVSGTFLYAMSSGCPIISNAFVLATEMLDEKTGVILTTGSAAELAANAVRILQDPSLKKSMSEHAFSKTRNTTWEKVAQKHVKLFYHIFGMRIRPAELTGQYIY